MNKCDFIGRFVADPELSYTPNGTAKCSFRLAVDRDQYKDANGDVVKGVDFIDFIAWQKTAEFIANPKYFEKGKPIRLETRAVVEQWEDTEGNKRSRTLFKVLVAAFVPTWSGGSNSEEDEEEKPKKKEDKKSGGFKPSQKKRTNVNNDDEEIQEEYL